MEEKKIRHAFRLPPCPDYDVEGMESWLSDLAGRGLHLAQDGIFAGVATFERGKPQPVRYRLAAAQGSTSMWADNNGDPDPEEVELGRQCSWEYVAKRGNFYIYRALSPNARELDTDPEVQALALETVRKRRRSALFQALFWAVLYPLVLLRGSILLTMVELGTWFVLWTAGMGLWLLADRVAEVASLGRLQKKLRESGSLARHKNWQTTATLHRGKVVTRLILIAVWVCAALNLWSASVLHEDRMLISDYTGTIPFATLTDLAGPGYTGYQATMTDLSYGFNTVEEHSDPVAPRSLRWFETADVTRADGSLLSGSLEVNYYQMASPALARTLAWECARKYQLGREYTSADLPELECDYAAAFADSYSRETVVLQKGNTVLQATFYQYQTSDNSISLEEWAAVLAESIG